MFRATEPNPPYRALANRQLAAYDQAAVDAALRNVAKTGLYFHDGRIASTEDAVKKMASHQLGKKLSDAETVSTVALLGSLTGSIDATQIAGPALPESDGGPPR